MSSVTGDCVHAYREGVDSTCDSVDGAIKSMYALMAKCEELSRAFKPVYQLADKMYPYPKHDSLLLSTKVW